MANLEVGGKDEAKQMAQGFYSILNSGVRVEKKVNGEVIDFQWVSMMEQAIPYIDKIFANPKRFIINEELILDVAKSKKVTQESVKHLAKHTNYIATYNEETDELRPDKLLNVLKEDTYFTYENRFIYTLVDFMEEFIFKIMSRLNDTEFSRQDQLLYKANTNYDGENIGCKIQIDAVTDNNSVSGASADIKKRIEKIQSNISQWKVNEVYASLAKQHAPKVTHPIKRTNVILKNPDFQQAVILWDYLYSFLNEIKSVDNENTCITHLPPDLTKFIENSFLIDYLVLKFANSTTQSQKDRYSKYIRELALKMFRSSIDIIKTSDDNIKRDELVEIINEELQETEYVDKMDYASVEHKIKSTIKDYIDRIEDSYFIIGDEGDEGVEDVENNSNDIQNN